MTAPVTVVVVVVGPGERTARHGEIPGDPKGSSSGSIADTVRTALESALKYPRVHTLRPRMARRGEPRQQHSAPTTRRTSRKGSACSQRRKLRRTARATALGAALVRVWRRRAAPTNDEPRSPPTARGPEGPLAPAETDDLLHNNSTGGDAVLGDSSGDSDSSDSPTGPCYSPPACYSPDEQPATPPTARSVATNRRHLQRRRGGAGRSYRQALLAHGVHAGSDASSNDTTTRGAGRARRHRPQRAAAIQQPRIRRISPDSL